MFVMETFTVKGGNRLMSPEVKLGGVVYIFEFVSPIPWFFKFFIQGITGIRFSAGEKCYIKTQVKAHLPDVEALNKESMTFELVG